MDVKFNLIQPAMGQINTGKKAIQGNNYAISDSCTLGSTIESLPEKPVFNSVSSSPPPSFNLASALTAQNAAASSITPAPFGPALAERLKELTHRNVEFFEKRNFRIPLLMSPYKEISYTKAEEALKQNPDKRKPVVFAATKDQTPLPLTDQTELDRLTTYKETNIVKNQQTDLMRFLKTTEDNRFQVNIRGSKYSGGYAAYKYLSGMGDNLGTSEQKVDISMYGVTLLSISPQDVTNVKSLEKRLNVEMERFKDLGNSEKLYKALYESPVGVPMDDKLKILKDIHKNSYGDTDKKRVSRVMDQYNIIRNSSKDDKDFAETGKLYSEFLAVRNSCYWNEDTQESALKFIIDDLKNRPEDFRQFVQLVGDKVPVAGAIGMYKNLPQPPKPGDYKKVSDAITKGSLREDKHVDFLMKPAGDSTLEERVEVLNGLYKHSQDSYSDKTWKYSVKAFDMIRRFSTEPGDFARIGKMCVQMLEANNDTYWRDDNKVGIKFVATKLKDKPEDFKTFIKLLEERTSIKSAMEIFHNVPSSRKIVFDKAADVFKKSPLKEPEQVAYLMEPLGDTTLEERLSIAENIFAHSSGGYSENKWKNCRKELENLKTLARDGRDFVKIGGMFVDMLKANNDTYWRKNYADGMKFIAVELKDKPDEFKTFLSMLKNRMNIDSAMEIYKDVSSTNKNGTYREAADIFTGRSITNKESIAEIMKPVGNTPLKDRMEIAEGIYNHSGGDYSEDHWKNTLKEFNRLKSLCPNDEDFLKVGKMFTEMLGANNDRYWRKTYAEGMELIVSDLKDNPEHFSSFIKMISDRMTIPAAVKAYRMLPEDQKTGKLENAAEVLKKSRLNSPEQVELLMEPVGSSSLKDRLEIAEGIYNHSCGGDSSDTWNNTVKNYKLLKSLTKDDGDFVKLGKLSVQLLDANNDRYFRNNYSDAIRLIAGKLMNKPDEFETLLKPLHSRFNLDSAMKLYNVLPENHSKEEFAEVVSSFIKTDLRSPEQIELLMKPIGDSTLDERIEIAGIIYKHSQDDDAVHTQRRMAADYQYIKDLTVGSGDFVKLGKMYCKMLEAENDRYYRFYNRTGLDFISARLKDSPESFNDFINFVKNGGSIESAIKIHKLLPQPVKPEEYGKTTEAYLNNKFTNTDCIELTMAPAGGASLEDRITIAKGILNHVQDSDSSGMYKNMKKLYNNLKAKTSGGDEFAKIGKLFVRMLDANNSRYMKDEYWKALDFLLLNLKDNPVSFEVFESFLKASSVASAIEAFETIRKPVKGEDLKTRGKAAEKILGKEFQQKYEIICRNIPQGDTIEDTGVLMGAIWLMPNGTTDMAKNEAFLQRIQQAKGSLRGAQIEKLVKAFHANNADNLVKAIKTLDLPGDNESYEAREALFLKMSTGERGITQQLLEETTNIFQTVYNGKLETEAFSKALSRFGQIMKFYQEKKQGDPKEVRDIYLRLMDELKKGTFRQQTPDQVTEKLLQILLVANTIESAFDQLIYASRQQEDKTIIRGENEITIGGVKLKKAKRK